MRSQFKEKSIWKFHTDDRPKLFRFPTCWLQKPFHAKGYFSIIRLIQIQASAQPKTDSNRGLERERKKILYMYSDMPKHSALSYLFIHDSMLSVKNNFSRRTNPYVVFAVRIKHSYGHSLQSATKRMFSRQKRHPGTICALVYGCTHRNSNLNSLKIVQGNERMVASRLLYDCAIRSTGIDAAITKARNHPVVSTLTRKRT